MQTRHEIIIYIKRLADYAATQGRDEGRLNALIFPLIEAVNAYYSVDITANIAQSIEAITHALVRTGIVYADGSSDAGSGAEPAGYNDVRVFFVEANRRLLSTTEEAFNSSINEVTPESSEGNDVAEPYYVSSLVDSLTADYTANVTGVTEYLKAIAAYGNSAGLGNALQKLLEPKEVKTVPSMADIAKDIYIGRGYKELIEFQGIDIYIPASIGGAGNA